jgi:dephospho-CoA kinase
MVNFEIEMDKLLISALREQYGNNKIKDQMTNNKTLGETIYNDDNEYEVLTTIAYMFSCKVKLVKDI